MTEPIRPTNVRIVDLATGAETPCELAYNGLDEYGMHQWLVSESNTFDPMRNKIKIGILPPRTGISFPVKGDS